MTAPVVVVCDWTGCTQPAVVQYAGSCAGPRHKQTATPRCERERGPRPERTPRMRNRTLPNPVQHKGVWFFRTLWEQYGMSR